MKKTFSLSAPDRNPQRVIDAIKHEVRKYVKRERRKTLPADTDFWDFACKVGTATTDATAKPLNEINATVLHLMGIDHSRFSYKFQGLDQRLTGVEERRVITELLA